MKTVHALNVLLVGGLIGFSVTVYPELPQRIPLHFGAGGEADRWGDRTMLRWLLLPLVAAGACAITYFAAWLSARNPRRVNLPDRKKLLQLPRESQLWVLQGFANPLYVMALILNVAMWLLQYGAYLTATEGNGRAAIMAGLLVAILCGPFIMIGLLLGFQRRMDQAWRQHRLTST